VQRLKPAVNPRFTRWFVLDVVGRALSIYTTEADHKSGAQPKKHVDNLAHYASVRLKGDDGKLMIALLPHTGGPGALEGARPLVGSPAPLMAGEAAAVEGKSWYLRCSTDKETLEWFRLLRRAGTVPYIKYEPTVRPPPAPAQLPAYALGMPTATPAAAPISSQMVSC
jgi:hypothetical protein